MSLLPKYDKFKNSSSSNKSINYKCNFCYWSTKELGYISGNNIISNYYNQKIYEIIKKIMNFSKNNFTVFKKINEILQTYNSIFNHIKPILNSSKYKNKGLRIINQSLQEITKDCFNDVTNENESNVLYYNTKINGLPLLKPDTDDVILYSNVIYEDFYEPNKNQLDEELSKFSVNEWNSNLYEEYPFEYFNSSEFYIPIRSKHKAIVNKSCKACDFNLLSYDIMDKSVKVNTNNYFLSIFPDIYIRRTKPTIITTKYNNYIEIFFENLSYYKLELFIKLDDTASFEEDTVSLAHKQILDPRKIKDTDEISKNIINIYYKNVKEIILDITVNNTKTDTSISSEYIIKLEN